MKEKIALVFYICAVVFLTVVHNIAVIATFLLIIFLLSIDKIKILVRKSFISVLLFNGIISVSYIVYSLIYDKPWVEYIVLLNLRVFAITYVTFFFVEKVNLFKAFSFSRTFTYILVLSSTQILIFKRLFEDFKLALKSRTITQPEKKDKYNFISTVFLYFLNKSLNNTKEISYAMKSRGFFIE